MRGENLKIESAILSLASRHYQFERGRICKGGITWFSAEKKEPQMNADGDRR
jgi:hypothetical protein